MGRSIITRVNWRCLRSVADTSEVLAFMANSLWIHFIQVQSRC